MTGGEETERWTKSVVVKLQQGGKCVCMDEYGGRERLIGGECLLWDRGGSVGSFLFQVFETIM